MKELLVTEGQNLREFTLYSTRSHLGIGAYQKVHHSNVHHDGEDEEHHKSRVSEVTVGCIGAEVAHIF